MPRSRSREPGAAHRGEAQAVALDLALVKDETDAEEYDMSQHGQEQDLSALKHEYEIDIEEHDLLQQKLNLNCCEVEQASQPGSSARPELSMVKVEAGAQELSWVMGADPQCMSQELLVKGEPIKFMEGSQTAQGASSHSVGNKGRIIFKIKKNASSNEIGKLFSSTVVLRDCGAELQQSGRYCQECRVQFCSPSALADHYMLPTEPPNKNSEIKCKLCEFRCASHTYLKRHMFTHTGEKPYKCNQCQYSCTWRGELIVHKRTHTGEKPYKCDQCQYSSAFIGDLKTHIMRCHSGEKPFKCDQCQSSFARSYSLVYHKRTHTGLKPFKCDQCEFGSVHKKSFLLHKMTHTGDKPFKCDQCDYSSAQRGNLIAHKWTHSSEKPFKCDQCQYTCIQKRNLIAHKMNHTE